MANRHQHPAILGNHRRQSQQSRLELGLRCNRGFSWANDVRCGCAPRRPKAFRCARRWKTDCVHGTRISGLSRCELSWLAGVIFARLSTV